MKQQVDTEKEECYENEMMIKTILKYSNYFYFPKEIEQNSVFFYLCKYKYSEIIKLFLNTKKQEIDKKARNSKEDFLRESAEENKIYIVYYLLSKKNEINEIAFQKCQNLERLSIPPSIKTICEYSFSNCASLTEIYIPSKVESIKKSSFSECRSLSKINIPKSVKLIEPYTFQGCSSLTEISIPSSITSIGELAFNKCNKLHTITIPNSVTEICKDSFNGCSSLMNIYLPSSITTIGPRAFYGCSSLQQLIIPKSITQISKGCMKLCKSLKEITIPESVKIIEKYSFAECSSLVRISFENLSSVKSIGNNAFEGCSALTQIENIKYNKNFIINSIISQEDFYEVYEAEFKETKEKLLAKIFNTSLDQYSPKERDKVIQSFINILQINHPSIVKSFKLIGNEIEHENQPTLLTEFTSNVTLKEVIGSKLNDTKKLINIYGIALGMSYLHSKNILHYDLTPSNIIEDSNFYPKIKDFGLKGIFNDLQSIQKIKEISKYSAPECYTDNKYTKESEVYSFGLIAYLIMANKLLFNNDDNIIKHAENIINENYSISQEKIPKIYKELIKRCLSKEPTKRPSFEEIVKELENNREFITKFVNESEFKKYKDHIKTAKEHNEEYSGINEDNDNNNGNNSSNEKGDKKCEGNDNKKIKDNSDKEIKNKDDNDNDDIDKSGKNCDNNDNKEKEEEEEEEEEEEKEGGEEKQSYKIKKNELSFLKKKQIRNINEYKKVKTILYDSAFVIAATIPINNDSTKNDSINNDSIKYTAKIYNKYNKKCIIADIMYLSQLSYPSIPKFISFCPTNFEGQKSPVMIFEYMKNGTIQQVIEKIKNDQKVDEWNETTKMINVYGIASTMQYIHSQEIIHRNLEASSIFLDDHFYPKITNFILSIKTDDVKNNNEIVGPSPYIAPEIWMNYEYSKLSDVYAFGILVYEIMTNTLVYRNERDESIMCLVAMKKQKLTEVDMKKIYKDIIDMCIYSEKRPTFDMIVEMLENEFANNSDLIEYKKSLVNNQKKD